jgi:hypothetical protein
LRAERRGQQLQERADRRHRESAGQRIDVAHLPAVAGIRRFVPRERSERSRLRSYG